MEAFNNHRILFGTAFLFFVVLSFFVAVLPAITNQRNNAPLPGSEALTADAFAGKKVYIANGCVACHSQQVRGVDMDKTWGSRPGVAADYARNTRMSWWMNTATLMGTERTGPDLTDIGRRLPSADWHLLHLYNPRAVVEESIMPAYPWLFEWKAQPNEDDKVVLLPEEFSTGRGKLVAKQEALQLVAYLQALQQTPLPDGTARPEFLYKREERSSSSSPMSPSSPSVQTNPLTADGAQLYAANCQACHQANGQGLPGAFPSLKGSAVVVDDDPRIFIEIIMNGYDAREEYAQMPAVGTMNGLTAEEVTAIANHERTNWGNGARLVSVDEVRDILTYLETNNNKTSTE